LMINTGREALNHKRQRSL